jgi:A/G-specific adenine glycosylase
VKTSASLLRWYRRHRRDLPWRQSRDPYSIWIAETMLQQTRSETVLRYYRRFLRRFPSVSVLARAPESAVLAAWSGLGYYARARNVRLAARQIVARHGRMLPADPRALRALPGIGRYTAGAVASIAFGVATPVVDGNVARVLARHFKIRGAIRSPKATAALWQIAEGLVDRSSPGDWNQALMELGARLCTPRAPACLRCPLRPSCAAYRTGWVDRLPDPPPRRPPRRVRRACVVLADDERVLMVHRGRGRLLRGLWEFPAAEARAGETLQAAAERELARLGIRRAPLRGGARIRHTITNRRIETFVFYACVDGHPPACRPGTRWFAPRELARLPLSAVGLRIAAGLGSNHSPAPRSYRPSRRGRREVRLEGAPTAARERSPRLCLPAVGEVR